MAGMELRAMKERIELIMEQSDTEPNINKFNIIDTELDGVKLIKPYYMEDGRGYFLKNYEHEVFHSFGLTNAISEAFISLSKKDVIRGLHFQSYMPQIKYVRVIQGIIYDVVVDLRRLSPSFARWRGFELSDHNHLGIWIPAGFAHGFRVISEEAIVEYLCIGKYYKQYDTGIVWNDPDLAINWGIDNPIVSDRDSKLQLLREYNEKQLSKESADLLHRKETKC